MINFIYFIFLFLLNLYLYQIVSKQTPSEKFYYQISNTNKILLADSINKNSVKFMFEQIDWFIKNSEDNKIFIIIDSKGGDLLEGIKLIKYMEFVKKTKNIRFECVGFNVISSAFNIYQFCDYRYFLSKTIFIQHNPIIYISGTFEYIKNYTKKYLELDFELYNWILKLISKKLKISPQEYIEKFDKSDWIIKNHSEIYKNNLADEIIYYLIN